MKRSPTVARTARITVRIVVGVLAVTAIAAFFYRAELRQLWRLNNLFAADSIVYNFQHIDELFPTRSVPRGEVVFEFDRGTYELPASFAHLDRSLDVEVFLEQSATTGLLIVDDDTIVFERYSRGHSEDGRHIAWSVSKSVVSALFGIAIAEGHIDNIHQPVTDYLPELAGSGYDGVPIKHVLQMSSGVGFNEDYGDPRSDINRMGRVMALGGALLDFAATLDRARPPGTYHHYVSIDTQVLGTILVRATGKSLAELTSEKLWKPLGMESDAYWIIDSTGMEMALGGLNAALRDYARFARLYLQRGRWNGVQIVPEAWVDASLTPDAPHLMPGENPASSTTLGYGFQWWIPPAADGEFLALGVYNQMIYVYPKKRLIIVKNSANRNFQRDNYQATRESISFFRRIAADFDSAPSAGDKLGM